MARGERTIKIKFDGTAAGLRRAARDAERTIDDVDRKVKRASDGIGSKTGTSFLSGVMDALQALPAQLKGAAIVAAVAIGTYMSPAIGAALAAGVMLALGGGVLAAGIIAATNHPKIQAAFDRLKERAAAAFKGFDQPFINPLRDAITTFARAIEAAAPTIKQWGRDMAPIIDRLAPALAQMALNALPGISAALKAGKPLWDTLAAHLPGIGTAISKFFDKIAASGPQANQFLDDFLAALEVLIPMIGSIIGWLARMYVSIRLGTLDAIAAFLRFGAATMNIFGQILEAARHSLGWIPGLDAKLAAAAADFRKFRDDANAALRGIQDQEVRIRIKPMVDRYTGIAEDAINAGIRSVQGGSVVKKRARGGPVFAGRTYLVGEQGPELLRMGAVGGHVTPNDALSGPSVLEAHIHIGDEVVRVVRTEIRAAGRGLASRLAAGSGRSR